MQIQYTIEMHGRRFRITQSVEPVSQGGSDMTTLTSGTATQSGGIVIPSHYPGRVQPPSGGTEHPSTKGGTEHPSTKGGTEHPSTKGGAGEEAGVIIAFGPVIFLPFSSSPGGVEGGTEHPSTKGGQGQTPAEMN